MRYMLAVAVLIFCSKYGIDLWKKVKDRSVLLEETALTIDCFKNEIGYSSMPLNLLVEKYSEADYRKPEFIKLCNEKIRQGTDFPTAWKNSVMEKGRLFSAEDRSRLFLLGDLLGTSDLKSQCEILSTQQLYFCERARQSKAKTEKYGSSFICSGIFLGFAFFIFIV